MKSRASQRKEDLAGLSSKMYPGSLIAITEKISEVSLQRWMNSGMAYRGEFSMQNILEHPSGVVESTLSQVVEASAPREYYLTKEQITSWLARASEKKISLPKALRQALEAQSSTLSSTQRLVEKRPPDRKRKVSEMTAKPTPSTREEAATLYARRLLPSECETLQGFPKNWTAIDIER